MALSFDIDNASPALSTGNLGAQDLSRGEYGAIDGLPRILRLLDRHNIPATFFIPALAAALHPEMIPDILSKTRHEIGIHGWIHEHLPSLHNEAEERRLLMQSIEYMAKAIGKRPAGYRISSNLGVDEQCFISSRAVESLFKPSACCNCSDGTPFCKQMITP